MTERKTTCPELLHLEGSRGLLMVSQFPYNFPANSIAFGKSTSQRIYPSQHTHTHTHTHTKKGKNYINTG